MKKKRRRPKCLTDLKTDVVAGKVFPEVAAETQIPGVAQRVALVEDRVAVKVADQGEKDSVNRPSPPIAEKVRKLLGIPGNSRTQQWLYRVSPPIAENGGNFGVCQFWHV